MSSAATCLHPLIARQAMRTPHIPALIAEQVLTYHQLQQRSNRLAQQLQTLGIGVGTQVGLCLHRNRHLAIALLATLKTGAAFVALDPQQPPAQRQAILDDATITLVLTEESLSGLLTLTTPRLCLDAPCPVGVTPLSKRTPAPTTPTPENLACIAYLLNAANTPEKPQGIRLSHRELSQLMYWGRDQFPAEALHGTLFSTAIGTDPTVFELFLPLCWGGTAIFAEHLAQLPQLTPSHPITWINTEPSTLAALLQHHSLPSSVHTLCLTGEPDHTDPLPPLYTLVPTLQQIYRSLTPPALATQYSQGYIVPPPAPPPTHPTPHLTEVSAPCPPCHLTTALPTLWVQYAQSPTYADAIAVEFDEQRVSYQELYLLTEHLADYLRALQLPPNSLIAICMNRSLERLLAVLAVQAIEATCLAIDPEIEAAQQQALLQANPVAWVITQSRQEQSCHYPHQLILDHWEQVLNLPSPLPLPMPPTPPAEEQTATLSSPEVSLLSTADELAAGLAWWQQHWQPPHPAPLFAEWPRLGAHNDSPQTRYFLIVDELRQQLQQQAHQQAVTIESILLSVFALVLLRYTEKTEMGIRITPGQSATLLALRLRSDALSGFSQFLHTVHPLIQNATRYQSTFQSACPELTATPADDWLQVGFILHNTPPSSNPPQPAHPLILQLALEITTDGLVSQWQFDPHQVDSATIEQMADYYQHLLLQIMANPDIAFDQLHRLPPEMYHQLRYRWNDNHCVLPDLSLVQRFEQQVAATPDKTALVFADQRLSYQQLNQQINQLTYCLQQRGIQPGQQVAICLERSPPMLVVMWAIIKTGASYLPLDPHCPLTRLNYVLADAQPHWLIADEWLTEEATLPIALSKLNWQQLQPQLSELPTTNPIPVVIPHDRLYVLYPPNSTGWPHPVTVTPHNLNNLLQALQQELNLTATDKMLLISSFSTALAQKNLYWILLVGGELHLLAGVFDPKTIAQHLATQQISVLNCPPSQFYPILPYHSAYPLTTLRYLIFGEAPALTQNLAGLPPTTAIISTYSNIECSSSDVATLYRWPQPLPPLPAATETPIADLCLGRPISNVQAYIFDAQQRLVPPGAVGELFIGGAGLNPDCPDLLEHPLALPPTGKLCRTGYRVRYQADGQLLEMRLSQPQPQAEPMQPNPFYVAPHTPVEEWLIPVWQQVLGKAPLGIDDNFFEHGGHSTLAAQVISQVKATFDLELPLTSLYENPTLRRFAERLENQFWSDIPGHDLDTWLLGHHTAMPEELLPQLAPEPTELLLPIDCPHPTSADYHCARWPLAWPLELINHLNALAHRQEAQLWMVLLAAWQTLLHRYTGQPIIATAVMLPLPQLIHSDFNSYTDFQAVLDFICNTGLKPINSRVPTESRPLQIQFSLSANPNAWPDITGETIDFELALTLQEQTDGAVSGYLDYASELFYPTSIQRFSQHLTQLLEAIGHHSQQAISKLPLLTEEECQHFGPNGWNNTQRDYSRQLALHQLIEQQVSANPNALAIISPHQKWRYGDLNRRANQLAHHLHRLGLKPGEGVAVHLAPSPFMVMAVLAIIKAGGAYLPFATQWPLLRVTQVLQQFPVKIVITDQANLAPWLNMQWDLPSLQHLVCIDSDTPRPPVERWDEAALDRLAAYTLLNPKPEFELNILPFIEPWLNANAGVLEIGCGHGHLVFELAPRITHYVALDPSPTQQQHNHRKAVQRGFSQVQWLSGFAHEIDELAAASFDIILVAGHLLLGPLYTEQVLDQALRCVVPGGIIVLMGLKNRQQDAEYGLEPLLFHDYAVTRSRIANLHVETHDNHYEVCFYTETEPQETLNYPRHKLLWTQWHLRRLSEKNPCLTISPQDRALISFISGTTGPLGVEIRHQALVNALQWANQEFQVTANDRLFAINPLCAERAIYDLFGPLLAGASLEIANTNELDRPAPLVARLRQSAITLWNSVPATLHLLLPELRTTPLPHLRLLLLSGEPVTTELLTQLYAVCPQAHIVSLQGAPETTVWATWQRLNGPHQTASRPIHNMQHFILDNYLNPCPIGIWGDFYWSGDSLATAYIQAPELTASHFINFSHPLLSNQSPRTLYRSGYRARFLADGQIEWRERLDRRVTVHGYRLELGEIETILNQHLAIRESVVMAHQQNGHTQIIAYCVPQVSLDRIAVDLSCQVMLGTEQYILTVQDLSPTGARLHGIPAHWLVGETLTLSLALPGMTDNLEATIIWKRLPVAGVQFNPNPEQYLQLESSIRQLTEQQGFSVANLQRFHNTPPPGPSLNWRGICLLKTDSATLECQTEEITLNRIILTGLTQRWKPQQIVTLRLLWPPAAETPWLQGQVQWQAGQRMGIQLELSEAVAMQHEQHLTQTLKTEGYWLTRHNLTALRAHVQRYLPTYMVPSHFVLLDHLPLTASGELDRPALLALATETG